MSGTKRIDLDWPRNADQPDTIEVGLNDVRAADNLIIRYDFKRDGWVITRRVMRDLDWMMEDTGVVVEVAFIEAWTLETPNV